MTLYTVVFFTVFDTCDFFFFLPLVFETDSWCSLPLVGSGIFCVDLVAINTKSLFFKIFYVQNTHHLKNMIHMKKSLGNIYCIFSHM